MEKTESSAPASKRRFKPTEIIVALVFIIIIIVLVVTLVNQLSLKSEVSGAKVVSNQVVNDIRQDKASDVHNLGNTPFQKNHSSEELASLFTSANQYAKGTPEIVSQIVTNDKSSQNVGIVYKYSAQKTPYYIRVVTTKTKSSNKWQVAAISGGNNQTALENNKN